MILAYDPPPAKPDAGKQRCQMNVCPLTRVGSCILLNAMFIFRSRIRNTVCRLVSKSFCAAAYLLPVWIQGKSP